jgi:hypothetical protein
MSKILEAVTMSLEELKDTCGCAKFSLPHKTGEVVIPVPRTCRGRKLYRSLLLEIGRMERDDMRFQVTSFTTILEAEGKDS